MQTYRRGPGDAVPGGGVGAELPTKNIRVSFVDGHERKNQTIFSFSLQVDHIAGQFEIKSFPTDDEDETTAAASWMDTIIATCTSTHI